VLRASFPLDVDDVLLTIFSMAVWGVFRRLLGNSGQPPSRYRPVSRRPRKPRRGGTHILTVGVPWQALQVAEGATMSVPRSLAVFDSWFLLGNTTPRCTAAFWHAVLVVLKIKAFYGYYTALHLYRNHDRS